MSNNNKRSLVIILYAFFIAILSLLPDFEKNVPFTLQDIASVAAGALMGIPQGASAVGIFFLMGFIGLPVFAGNKGGIAVFSGNTGGFLVGYFIGAIITGLIAKKPLAEEKPFEIKNILKIALSVIVGIGCVFFMGLTQYMKVESQGIVAAINICVSPFFISEAIKIAVSVPIIAYCRPKIAKLMYNSIN